MKPILILTTILIGVAFYGFALGKEELNGQLYVDFDKETAVYSEVHEFEMTASVEPNLCNYCLQNFNSSSCLTICESVVVID